MAATARRLASATPPIESIGIHAASGAARAAINLCALPRMTTTTMIGTRNTRPPITVVFRKFMRLLQRELERHSVLLSFSIPVLR